MKNKSNVKKSPKESCPPRLSSKRKVFAIIFNSLNILLYAAFGAYGIKSHAFSGAIMCFVFASLFCMLSFFSLKILKENKPIFSPGKTKPLRIAASVTAWVLAIFLLLQIFLSVIIYEHVFNGHIQTYEPYSLTTDVFDGLEVTECRLEASDGHTLAGYMYFKPTAATKGVLIISHGFGSGGQNKYMAVADYFASNGYKVFAYDATGNDKSDGNSSCGLPNGIADLDLAINYIEKNDETSGMPIVLFGHSWGAYCVSTVLNIHPEIKAVVSISGFNSSSDMLKKYSRDYVGYLSELSMPFINAYERIKFGTKAVYTSESGFDNTNAGVFIVHSTDDDTVPIECGFESYYNKYKDSERFTFVKYEDRGHNRPFYSDLSREYIESFNEQFAKDFGYSEKIDPKEKADYLHENLDKKKMYDLDGELFSKILDFYDFYTAE